MTTRRQLLKHLGLAALWSATPSLGFARAATDRHFVLVILRGALDGLALAAPYGDGNYQRIRGELALSSGDDTRALLKLDGMFGLHPALTGVHADYQRGQVLVVHAIASPYRERSHFDGQDVLENGATRAGALRDGWLNRALTPFGGPPEAQCAIAMAQNPPLVLRGGNAVTSWAPSRLPDADLATLERLQDLYSGDEFLSTRLAEALRSQDIAGPMAAAPGKRRGNDAEQLRPTMQAAARFLTAPDGPRIAVAEAGGWDTHANQGAGTGVLATRLAALDAALTALRDGLGPAWDSTAVAVVTEFGRTAAVNGTRGTDHGTATAALLLGGAINGGRVLADWPGLRTSDLYEGRDLRPTADLRSLFKGLLAEHLGLPSSLIDDTVFPDSAAARPMRDLIRG